MPRTRLTTAAVLACAAAALATPHAASAKGGGGGSSSTCTPLRALNSGVIDKPASGKPVTVDVQATNCTGAFVETQLRVVATTNSLRSTDPYSVETCTGAPYSGQGAPLKPGESRSLEAAASVPFCGVSSWGIDVRYTVDYAVSLVDTATGAVLGTTTSTVVHQGGA